MKRLRPGQVVAVVLLLAVSLIPTRSFALSEGVELAVTYIDGGAAVGGAVYESCFGGFSSSWGQQSGTIRREKYTYCSSGQTYCYVYSWDGSDWQLVMSGDCEPDGDRDRPDRPRF